MMMRCFRYALSGTLHLHPACWCTHLCLQSHKQGHTHSYTDMVTLEFCMHVVCPKIHKCRCRSLCGLGICLQPSVQCGALKPAEPFDNAILFALVTRYTACLPRTYMFSLYCCKAAAHSCSVSAAALSLGVPSRSTFYTFAVTATFALCPLQRLHTQSNTLPNV